MISDIGYHQKLFLNMNMNKTVVALSNPSGTLTLHLLAKRRHDSDFIERDGIAKEIVLEYEYE